MWKNPDIDPSAFIAPSADIYGDVSIAENCSIWFHATVRAGAGSVSIGAGTNVQDNCVIHVDRGYSVTVGKNVTIGHSAIVHGCSVGDNTLIGMGAIVLNGASVGKNCIVGAGALVTQNMLPAHKISVQQHHGLSLYIAESFDFHFNMPPTII